MPVIWIMTIADAIYTNFRMMNAAMSERAVPEFHFFLALLFLRAQFFGSSIYFDRPSAPYYASAFTTLFVLVSTCMGKVTDIESKFLMRILLIALATLLCRMALAVLARFWPNKTWGKNSYP